MRILIPGTAHGGLCLFIFIKKKEGKAMKLKRITAALLAAVMAASSVTVNVFADSSSEEVAVYTENDTNSDDDEDIDIPIPPDDEDTDEPEEPNEPPESPVAPDEPEDPDIPVEPFSYSVLDDGTVQITAYDGSAETVVIPDTIDGKSVTSIGEFAFSDCDSLTSITIPDSVTSIGESAFNGCTSLTSITIPDSVTSIGGWAFSGCTSIKSITIPDSVTEIGRSAFIDCTSLTSITIPDSVTEIGDYAFHGCSSLTAIDVEVGNNNYTSLNGVLFNKDKTELICYPAGKTDKSYNIPNSVTSIGDSAFEDCTSLTSITIPNGVTSIGESAFEDCSSLISITIPDSVTEIGSGAFSGCTSLTNITIPDSVTSIGDWAFSGCTSLTSITIPNSVTGIGNVAFQDCSSLTSITIPNSVTSIGNWAFESCTSLTTIDVEIGNNNYTSVNGVLFNKDKTELICYPAGKTDKSYNIPDSVTSIGDGAFRGCTSLTSITIPNGVTCIGDYAFYGCTSLTSIMIPNGVTSIGGWAFSGCTSFTSITIPDSVTSIGDSAFSGCTSLTSITIPDSVTEIGSDAFNGCKSLTSVTIPNGVTSIRGWTFNGCTSLTSVTIPDSVTSIGDSAFCNCSMLMNVEIPASVVEIGDRAFGYLNDESTLETIANDLFAIYCEDNSAAARYAEENDIPHKVPCIGPHTYSNEWTVDRESSFDNFGVKSHHCTKCGFATDITMIPQKYELIYETDEEGNLYVSGYRGKPVDVVIPAEVDEKSVTGIGKYAYNGCKSLTSITIPDSVTSIGDYAFSGCTSLTGIDVEVGNNNYTSVNGVLFNKDKTELICYPAGKTDKSYTIPNSVTRIDNGAFRGCTSLKSITIPNSVTSIGDSAFYWCTSLTSITIPDSVTSIGESAFEDCSSLISITIPDSVTSIGDSAFSGCKSLTAIDVEIGNNNYTSVNGVLFNKDKTELICYPAGKTDKSYNIPDSVTSIGDSAFSGCTSLTSVTIPDGVTSIGGGAFNGCTSLTSITIPDSVMSIGDWAFEGTALLDKQTTTVKYADSWVVDCDSDVETVMIKNGTKGIANRAFSWCSSLTSVAIPDGVTSIGDSAFSYCTSLTSITIPDSVTSIYDSAFSGCTSLTSITIPDSVTWIGNSAFSGCSSLTSVMIPDGVTSIGESAFSSCSSLTAIDVEVGNNNYTSLNGVLFNKDKTELICYPAGKTDKSYNIPNSVTSIGYRAFSGCTSLTSITIPNSVTSIGYYAFYGCTSLTSITIPNSVTSIGDYAFYDCSSLTSVTIPDNVTSIRDYTFSGCTSLTSITIPDSVTSIGDWAFGYYYDNGYKKIDNFKIYCYTGTAGEKYAKDKGFEYELLDHTQHTFGEWKTAKAATCTAEGTQARTCEVCGKVETQTIKALGHKEVIDKAVAATCTKTGLTEGIHCSVCDAVIKAQEVIPATGKHSFGEWKTTKPATCTEAGTQTRTCSVCGKVETQTIAKTAHNYVNTVVKPTYTAQGYTLHKCSVCGASYKDNYTAKLTIANMGGFKAKSKSYNSITLQWNKNASATGYELQKWDGKKWVALTKITKNSTTTYTVKNLKASTTYKYRIRAYKTIGKATQYSGYKELSVNTNPSNMSGFKAKSKSYNSITLQWNKNTSATGYELQKWNGKKWVALTKITKNSTTTYTVKSLKASTTYKYRIRAYKTIGKATQYSGYKELSVNTNPSNMSGFKAKSKSYNSITLQWNKNTSATGYELQKWNGKKWVALTKITKNSTTTYTVKSLKASTTYKYRIRAYKTIGKATQYSGYKELSVNTNPSNMSGFKAKSTAKTSVTLQWKKNTSATGYEIQKWNGKKWVSAAKVTKNSTVTSTVKNLKKNTSYKFRIRAYKTIGKATQYSSWSGTLTVRTKK